MMWAAFEGGNHWIEAGQVAGEGRNEYNLYFFGAYQNHSEGYREWRFPNGPGLNTWNTYTLQYANAYHTWGAHINGTLIGTAGGLGTTSNELEAGLEQTNTNIWNSGETTGAQNLGTQGLWWNGWEASGAGNYAQSVVYGYGCDYALAGFHGTSYFGAQPCGHNGWEPPRGAMVAPSGSGPTPATSGSTSGPTLTPEEQRAVAQTWSAKSGDENPTSISVVHTTRDRAMEVVIPGTNEPEASSTAGSHKPKPSFFRCTGTLPRRDQSLHRRPRRRAQC
jgi:hypothetical protein